MEDVKSTIAKNIVDLRKSMNMTQIELAKRLNYTDKAVSKWERAESLPDVAVLKEMAGLFGVTVDYLLEAEHGKSACPKDVSSLKRRNRLLITLLAITVVFSVATLLFVGFGIFSSPLRHLWILFVDAIPVSCIVGLVFNSIWGRRRLLTNCMIVSLMVWSALLAIYLSVSSINLWLLFVIGIPVQVILLLSANLKPYHSPKPQKK